MDFKAEHYFRAGIERMRQAYHLYAEGDSYAFAMYSAGLAVECILRAFRWLKDTSFEGRHDLLELFHASGFGEIEEDHLREKGLSPEKIQQYAFALRGAINTVKALWHNNLRFASEARLRAYLKQIGLYKGKKGDLLKANALDLINAADRIVDKGVALWISRKK